MNLYIPEIGDKLTLLEDWSFTLYNEHRNESLWKDADCMNDPRVAAQVLENQRIHAELENLESKYRSVKPNNHWGSYNSYTREDRELERQLRSQLIYNQEADVTIFAGTTLSVDRIYIRKGSSEYSSLSFFIQYSPKKTYKKKPRFWAKLADCNKIVFELEESSRQTK